jgi:hypothetical protein
MKQPDDYRQPDAPFQDEKAAGSFIDQQMDNYPRRQTVDRSFEIQSGYLVVIKQLGSRYALSFKRQIGTPPTSSIFLTADEGKRLANMFSAGIDPKAFNTETFTHIEPIGRFRTRGRSPLTMPTTLFLISLTLWAAFAILVFQMQPH